MNIQTVFVIRLLQNRNCLKRSYQFPFTLESDHKVFDAMKTFRETDWQ